MPALAPLRKSVLITSVAMALLVAGCSSKKKSMSTSSHAGSGYASEQALHDSVQYWEKRYKKNRNDRKTALSYGQALRHVGRVDQSHAVLERLATQAPKDQVVLAAYGKALAAKGKFQQALVVLEKAQNPTTPDWRLASAMGAIHDQLGNFDAARSHYDQALLLAPGEPSILSNYGLSYMLEGDLKSSESYLREAAKHRNADSRVRQNLALVLGLQGKFAEAERIASSELSPQQAQANMRYLKTMMAERGNWNKLQKSKKKKAG
ncbi:MAG: tetratricopeptide repeat protein [Cohaesibacter sp.]|jgi:Flp pilus assembly protein TadD|nr:tetratricopeptide repeat protein [Cohaesibacter sp.]